MTDTTKSRVLIVVTSHTSLGDTGHTTGVWLEELTTPFYAFADAGCEVTVASVAGGAVPVDPNSQAGAEEGSETPASVERAASDEVFQQMIAGTPSIAEIDAADYDAVFLPGGHGTMWDMPGNAVLAALLGKAWAQGKVVAAVCHGPAGLVSATDEDGKPLVAGRKVSAFTDSEERAAGLDKAVPFLLETRLAELGAQIDKGPDFEAHAVRDGQLVTGQNPASSLGVAQLVLEAITPSA
ncbi:type 1 glutamine amidotransferase domain-containing protein [Novosphingobium sp. 9]|uniref:type 1 glutamine amidotransferase domain-containing protein n=1 Tax=Novosphingobium sp. 9 TaxID=2025349 RepID=UPI0021B56AD4|nr:type 1 glutamine amidotransferase domain-containing protein [Novosphingobium sp. 9]